MRVHLRAHCFFLLFDQDIIIIVFLSVDLSLCSALFLVHFAARLLNLDVLSC